MNDVDFPVARVLEGIDAAAGAGLAPVKVNMVVKRGVNERSIVPMARFFRAKGHILRFIATRGYDLRAPLRGGAGDEEISASIAGVWRARADRYSEIRSAGTAGLRKVEMSYIGG